MAKTKVKVIVALFAVIALSLLAVCFGRLFSPAEAKAADGTYDDTAAVALMQDLITDGQATLTENVVFDLTVPSRITGSGTMKENGHMDIVGNKTIDLAGFTLTIITGSENCCVEVTPNASLTIKDSSAAGTGKVVGQSAGDFAWGQTGTSISLTNVDVEFTSTETGAAGDEGTTPGGSSEDHVILYNGSVELSGVTFDTNVSDPVAVFTKDAETGEFVGSDVTYGTLQDAINAGETSITLDKDYTESITVSKGQNVTLDLNGKTITNTAGQHTITNNGTLTIVGNGTVDNVSHGKGALVNYGVATLNGGTFTRSKEDGKLGSNSWYVLLNQGTITINEGVTVCTDEKFSTFSSLMVNGLEGNSAYPLPDGADSAKMIINGGKFVGGVATLKNDYYGVAQIKGGSFDGSGSDISLQNWGATEITGTPVFEEEVAAYTMGTSYVKGTTSVDGGIFNDGIAAYEYVDGGSADKVVYDKDNIDIVFGMFKEVVHSAYLAEGADLYVNEAGQYIASENAVDGATKVVAFAGDKAYGSIQEAINAADGAPVTLYDDVTLSEALTIDKAVTINLNGKTVSASTTAANITANATIKNGTIDYVGETSVNGLVVTNNATLTLEGVTVDYEGSGQAVRLGKGGTPENNGGNAVITDSEIKGGVAGVAMFGTAEGAANKTILTATDSTITGSVYYGIATNGIFYNNDITLSGTTVKGTSTGMYLPGSGETTITGGAVKGATGIEIRAGKLTIDGATVTATGAYEEPVPNGSGTTVEGVAIAVSQHTTERPIEVTVKGGNFNATGDNGKAFLEIDTVKDEEGETTPSEGVTIAISGGNFTAPVESKNKTEFVSGGTFTEVLDSTYLDENINMYVSEGKYTAATAENAPENAKLVVAVIGTKGYTSLNAAIADVKVGAASQFSEETTVITLMTDTKDSSDIGTSNGQAPKNVTIDLNGHTLTLGPGVGSAGTETAGLRVLAYSTLTVKNGTLKCSDDTADHIRVGIANYGKTTLENVTLDAAEVTQYPVNNRGKLTLKGDTTVENGGVYDIAITNDPYNYYYEDVDASLNIADPEVTVGTVRLELYGNATNNGVPVLNVSAGTLQTIITDGSNAIGFESNVSGATFEELPDAGLIGDSDMYQTADGKFKASDSTVEGATKVIAMVSDKAYDKLADAVAAATDGGTVTLYVDVKENITVASGTVTIDLAGNTLNGFIKSTGATVNVKNGTVSGSWIDGAVMANGEGASVTLTDTVIGNPISISNDGAVTLVRSTTRGRITVGSGSAQENYTAGTLTITDSIIEKEISVEMLGKVVISDTVEYKTSLVPGLRGREKIPPHSKRSRDMALRRSFMWRTRNSFLKLSNSA